MAAAEAVLRDGGADGFSMAAVSAAADMPIGNIYRRFESKDDLLQAIKDVVSGRITNGIAECLTASRHDTLQEFFTAFAGAVALIFARDEHLNRTLYDPRLANLNLARSGQAARSSIFEIFQSGLDGYLVGLDERAKTPVTRVSFSIVMNAAAFKVRDNDPISAGISWPELAAEFGGAAYSYVMSQLKPTK
ncbi:TetR/AcrR family transcriptional regulator [Rhizobium sp. BG4]|uniref:TetR/AcrR family transcriptional regulator n=1 Tax=Rhizobium sp. BG4 TaxID=2613770 RepID=UPI00193EB02F|nr:TetR/AcrR family transcriptional regulator [Rhizobium sp. BG4]